MKYKISQKTYKQGLYWNEYTLDTDLCINQNWEVIGENLTYNGEGLGEYYYGSCLWTFKIEYENWTVEFITQ